MTLIDIRRWLSAPAATAAAAILIIAAAAVVAGAARADYRQVQVTVTAYPADSAAAQITTRDGATATAVWGQPTELDGAPTGVSVITWAADRGASCTVWIDGVVVVEQTVAAAGQPASCVWP